MSNYNISPVSKFDMSDLIYISNIFKYSLVRHFTKLSTTSTSDMCSIKKSPIALQKFPNQRYNLEASNSFENVPMVNENSYQKAKIF